MRLILANRDADRLNTILSAGAEPPTIEFLPPRRAAVCVAGERFTGRARPTPGEPGSLRVEDMDGRVVLVADAE